MTETWRDIELDDTTIATMIELGMAEKVEVIRTTPLFDEALTLLTNKKIESGELTPLAFKGVAISGKAGAGKDTTCAALLASDPRYVRLSFADEVKRIASELTGLDFFNEEVKETNRWFLQVLGTELMRRFDENYWVKRAIVKAQELISQGKIIVCTDARFPNEMEALKSIGCFSVRLEVSPDEQVKRGRKTTHHASETALDDYKGFDLILTTEAKTIDWAASIIREEMQKE